MDELSKKLHKIKVDLDSGETSLKNIYQNIYTNPHIDPEARQTARKNYETYLSEHELAYQRLNEEYKQTISQFSKAYLSMCPYYVGPEIPRPHFLSTKNDVTQLYTLFLLAGLSAIFGINSTNTRP
jgi:hypothetical protein